MPLPIEKASLSTLLPFSANSSHFKYADHFQKSQTGILDVFPSFWAVFVLGTFNQSMKTTERLVICLREVIRQCKQLAQFLVTFT